MVFNFICVVVSLGILRYSECGERWWWSEWCRILSIQRFQWRRVCVCKRKRERESEEEPIWDEHALMKAVLHKSGLPHSLKCSSPTMWHACIALSRVRVVHSDVIHWQSMLLREAISPYWEQWWADEIASDASSQTGKSEAVMQRKTQRGRNMRSDEQDKQWTKGQTCCKCDC